MLRVEEGELAAPGTAAQALGREVEGGDAAVICDPRQQADFFAIGQKERSTEGRQPASGMFSLCFGCGQRSQIGHGDHVGAQGQDRTMAGT